MKYDVIVKGTFIDRPNRFIANVEINGKREACHVKNTGRCKELLVKGAVVYLAASGNPERKTRYDLVSVKKGEDWEEGNREIEEFLSGRMEEKNWAEAGKEQIARTAEAFAMDMLFLKFIQGLAVVGIIGGAGNPVYYNKVMKYVELKYRKRYLIGIYG